MDPARNIQSTQIGPDDILSGVTSVADIFVDRVYDGLADNYTVRSGTTYTNSTDPLLGEGILNYTQILQSESEQYFRQKFDQLQETVEKLCAKVSDLQTLLDEAEERIRLLESSNPADQVIGEWINTLAPAKDMRGDL